LPIEIRERVFSLFTRDADGNFAECADEDGFYRFLADNISQYPVLANLVKINEAAVIEHARKTGDVPPGVKLIKTEQVEGQNVTKVRIFHGPASIPEEDR
jgi:hypothetical protein